MTGRKVNKPGCATVRNQVTALFSLPMRLGQHVQDQLAVWRVENRAFRCYASELMRHASSG